VLNNLLILTILDLGARDSRTVSDRWRYEDMRRLDSVLGNSAGSFVANPNAVTKFMSRYTALVTDPSRFID
jgi:hypothetical protein